MQISIGDSVFYSKEMPTYEQAWNIADALKLLEYFKLRQDVISGGDILNNKLEYTYDNWFFNPDEEKSKEYNSIQSINIAYEYLKRYIQRNGENYYVVIVIHNQSSGNFFD